MPLRVRLPLPPSAASPQRGNDAWLLKWVVVSLTRVKRQRAVSFLATEGGASSGLTPAAVHSTLPQNAWRFQRAVAVFEVVGDITNIQVIATGRGIRRLRNLRKRHGGRRWRKLKGDATVRLANGSLRRAEIHWYEAHGVGKRGLKIKRFLD